MEYSLSPEVSEALGREKPIVALESTVIAHGLPFPKNLETAVRLENTIRERGAVPATIAIIDGVPSIGLNKQQLEYLASGSDIGKVSIRDLPIVVAQGLSGATTVASTLFFAHRAGLKVFATGGIGGVHRGGANDVSADLPALASTQMVVVCAGAKSVLDIASTREWLETHGVTILGWRTDEFPAFYSISSGLPVDRNVSTAEEVAAVVRARNGLEIETAIVVAAPIPDEFAIEDREIGIILEDAVKEAGQGKISGRELTPFLLSRIGDKSGGKTIEANIGLLVNNAKIAAEIALRLD